jgi:hypothetical protein
MYTIARVLLLAAPALATTVSVSTQSNTLTHYGCSTHVASTPHEEPMPTSTVLWVVQEKSTIHQVITTTPVITVQGNAITTTVTSTTTSTTTLTEPTITGTYTSTSTVDNTVTTTVATITSTETDDSSSTISSTVTATVTQPTPNGYVGITDSTSEQNAPASKKRGRSLVDSARQLAAERRSVTSPAKAKSTAGALPPAAGDWHPQQVLCTKTLETVFTVYSTSYAPTQTVTEPGSTVTATATSTATSTSTVVPSATTTVTATETDTVTSSATETDTTTTTTTATMTVSTTTTLYAACATNYLLGPDLANGEGVDNFLPTNADFADVLATAGSAYDCCVACQTSTGVCYGSWYGDGACYLVSNADSTGPGGVCSSTYEYGTLEAFQGAGQYTIANGPCGMLGPTES